MQKSNIQHNYKYQHTMIKSLIRTITKNTFYHPVRPTFTFANKRQYGKDGLKNWQKPLEHNDKNKQGYLHFFMYGMIFALCFAAIPLYRVFCEHMGLVGDADKKQYNFQGRDIVNLKKYDVKFSGEGQPGIDWQFDSVEKTVRVGASQTAIVFYRLYNREQKPIVGFSTYNIYPEDVNVYFSKIQCFCFNQQLVNPKQQLLLPLFFYLQPQINQDPDVSRVKQIRVHYQFFRSDKQDLAKFAQQQLQRVQQNKRKLNIIRARKYNLSLEEYEKKIKKDLQQQEFDLYNRMGIQPETGQVQQPENKQVADTKQVKTA